MKLIRWTYCGRGKIRAYFDTFPHSTVVLCKIRTYYFVHHVQWVNKDSIVEEQDLREMELLVNDALGTIVSYNRRRSIHS